MGETVINETLIIPETDIEQVFIQVIKWLERINAVVQEEKPYHISSLHVKRFTPDRRYVWSHWNPFYWEKIITIDLMKHSKGVELKFSVKSVDKPGILNDVRERWWGLVLLDFMNHMNLYDDALVKSLYPKETINKMIKDVLFSEVTVAPIILFVLGISLIYIDGINSIGLIILLSSFLFILPMSVWIRKISKMKDIPFRL
jgi:hypothetical protein